MGRRAGVAEHLRILAVDIGTGTQDILLFDNRASIENCLRLIMPSPTVIVAQRIARATAAGRPVLLTGHIMGGGPCGWAARDHAQAGFACYATADAARTLDDDLSAVEAQGLQIIADDDIAQMQAREGTRLVSLEMRDFDSASIRAAFAAFGVDTAVDAVAVAAFDHGAAPPGVSDRRFRFDAIAERVRQRSDALAFAYPRDTIPADLTRLTAVAADAARYTTDPDAGTADTSAAPVFVMDTGAAALAGALEDQRVREQDAALVANVGNFHTLAFHLYHGAITSLFEHHTGLLDQPKLEGYLRRLAGGTISNEEVFDDSGHGALVLATHASDPTARVPFLAVTGPRRELLRGSALSPYEAVPHGDMMLAGCFGLLRATAALDPSFTSAIEATLGQSPIADS